MKTGDLRELSTQELVERERELAQELFNLRFQMATGQLSNHTVIKKTRRDIARIKTVLKEKDSGSGRAGA